MDVFNNLPRALGRRPHVGAVAVAVLALLLAAPLPAAAATTRPDFQLPFPCGEVWHGTTYPTHSDPLAVDLNHDNLDDWERGRPVLASAAGDVVASGFETEYMGIGYSGYGNYVLIDHGGGWTSFYSHLERITAAASVGDQVEMGTKIGTMGDTGITSAVHLHYEQAIDGDVQLAYFDGEPIEWGADIVSNNCTGSASADQGEPVGAPAPAEPSCEPAANAWPHKVVDGFSTPTGEGYWLVFEDGTVTAHGDAEYMGDASCLALNGPIQGGAVTTDGHGYWLNAYDGGIFSFGSADFYGSMGGRPLTAPVFSMAAARSDRGYRLVARDGGIFAFGDVDFLGSLGGITLAQPIDAMVSAAEGDGYLLLGRDGGVFSFGDIEFYGSLPGDGLVVADVVGAAVTATGRGYWVARAGGQVHAFGDAVDLGGYQPPTGESVAAIFANPRAAGFRLVLSSGETVAFGDSPG